MGEVLHPLPAEWGYLCPHYLRLLSHIMTLSASGKVLFD